MSSTSSSQSKESPRSHVVEFEGDTATALAAAQQVAKDWGIEWPPAEKLPTTERTGQEREDQGFQLAVPAIAGLRRGEVTGRLHIEPAQAGQLPAKVRLRFQVEEEHYEVQRIQVAMLLSALLGCLIVLLWPFVPTLTPLVPVSVLIGLAAWFLVVARLANSGTTEFLEAVSERDDSS